MADTTAKTPSDTAADAPSLTPEELEAQIVATRERLASSVDELAEAANPVALAEGALQRVKEWFVDPVTGVRTERAAKVAAVVVGLLVLRGVVRRRS